jgi:hypothetical protein
MHGAGPMEVASNLVCAEDILQASVAHASHLGRRVICGDSLGQAKSQRGLRVSASDELGSWREWRRCTYLSLNLAWGCRGRDGSSLSESL